MRKGVGGRRGTYRRAQHRQHQRRAPSWLAAGSARISGRVAVRSAKIPACHLEDGEAQLHGLCDRPRRFFLSFVRSFDQIGRSRYVSYVRSTGSQLRRRSMKDRRRRSVHERNEEYLQPKGKRNKSLLRWQKEREIKKERRRQSASSPALPSCPLPTQRSKEKVSSAASLKTDAITDRRGVFLHVLRGGGRNAQEKQVPNNRRRRASPARAQCCSCSRRLGGRLASDPREPAECTESLSRPKPTSSFFLT